MMNRIRDAGLGAGLVGIGVCDAAPFDEVRHSLTAAVAAGRHAGMAFTFSRPDVASDVRASFPWATRLVVGAHAYVPAAGAPATGPLQGRVARFATEDHYVPLRRALGLVAAVLAEEGFRTEVLVDDGRLVDRAAAVRAGVGWWGKNTMVLAPRFGPWLLLGSVVTDAPLEPTPPMQRDCGTCEACLPACPTGALVAPGVLDARLCIAYWLQAPGVIPVAMREAIGDRVYGCDDCLEACPPGRRLAAGSGGAGGAAHAGRVDLEWLLTADDAALLESFDHFYIPRRRPDYLRRNGLVAVGNSGAAELVSLVSGYAGHENWLLRLHAAWALGRLGGPRAVAALRAAGAEEAHEEVRHEIAASLDGA